MEPTVGGRMEAVPPRRSLFGPDYLRLAVLLAVAVAVHVWLLVHTAVPARDSLAYARVALNLSDPNGANPTAERPRPRIEVVRTAEQPPGYPVAVWVTEKLLKNVTDLPLADRSVLATQLANAVAGVLLVVPMYLLGRMLFGRNVGFAAALLFQVLPVPATVTSDGLAEGVYLLAVSVAVLLGVRAVRRPGIGGFLLCGLATGVSYLVRPEGLMLAVGVGLVVGVAGASRRWPRDAAAGRLTALAVGVALVAVPYMVLIGKITNKPTGSYLTNPLDDQPANIWRHRFEGGAAPAPTPWPVFGVWWNPEKDAGRDRSAWAVWAVWFETSKALHYILVGLALFGLAAHRRQLFAPDPGLWVLLALGTLNLLLLVYLAARIGYVSERHTVLVGMLACVFAAAALEPLARLVTRMPLVGRLVVWPALLPAGILAAVVVSTFPYTFKPMHAGREGHKHAGRWLATHIAPGDWLIDPLSWAEWYAGRTLYSPVVYHGHPQIIWVVVEAGKGSPHSRIPQWEHAVSLTKGREPVYRWPEGAPPAGPAVEVYRIENPPPAPAAVSRPRRDAAAPPPPAKPGGTP